MFVRAVERVGRVVLVPVEETGRCVRIAGLALVNVFVPPFRLRLIFKQAEFIGVQSLGIVVLCSLFVGGVFALLSYEMLKMFMAETVVGSTVALAICLELGPVLTALLVTGRAGSAIAAEIGTMRVSEQVDALESMAVDPINFLVKPRVLAGIFMMPVLTVVFDGFAIAGSYLVGVRHLSIPEGPFVRRIEWFLDPDDIYRGLIKAVVFGLIMSVVGCYKGYYASGGAEGVGRATTQTVVISSVVILISDFFLTSVMM